MPEIADMIHPNPGRVTIDDALQHYFRLVAQGQVPDREAFCEEYPELASELHRRLSDIEFLNSMGNIARPQLQHLGYGVGTFDFSAPPDRLPKSAVATPELGGYQLIAEIGRGQQGYIYKARQRGTRRIVAVKVIREGSFASAAERQRFENEVQLASRLSHPHLVSVYEYGQDAGRDYYAMEFIEGVALDQHCDAKHLSLRQIAELFVRVCDGVGYAHEHGVLHRDLKPTNILVDDSGKPHVLDFGLAKAVGNDPLPQVTQVGEFAGTWVYASPEQVRRDPSLLDVRSDVYSLGVILYELVTGCLPYRLKDRSREAVAEAILNQEPRPPTQIVRDLDRDLETIIMRTLQKDSTRRYASATALADDLRRYLCGDPIEARRDETWYVLGRMLRRHRWKVAAFGGIFVVLVMFSIAISVLLSQTLIAKSEAVASLKTTDARLRVMQDANEFSDKIMRETQVALNIRALVEANQPNLSAIVFWNTPVDQKLLENLKAVGAPDKPWWLGYRPELFDFLAPVVVQRLATVDEELGKAVEILETRRPEFAIEGSFDASGVLNQVPLHLGLGEQFVAELSARGVWQASRGDFDGALRSLDAARRLVWSISAGGLVDHWVWVITIRQTVYAATCRVLEMNPTNLSEWERWLSNDDPPAPGAKGPGVLNSHMRCASVVAAATRVDPANNQEYLDISEIRRLTGIFDEQAVADERFRMVRPPRASPSEALKLIRDYFDSLPEAELLSHPKRQEWVARLRQRVTSDAAYDVLWPVLPPMNGIFRARGHCLSWRAAAQTTLRICHFRQREGRWPQTLVEFAPNGQVDFAWDPHMDAPLIYRLKDGRPLLYSVNEDGVDDDGKAGAWGAAGTDVVFFHP